MVTVAIIAILASIALPSYSEYITRSRLVDAHTRLGDLRIQMEKYFQDNRTYMAGATCGIAASQLATRQRRRQPQLRLHVPGRQPFGKHLPARRHRPRVEEHDRLLFDVDQAGNKTSAGPRLAGRQLLVRAQGRQLLVATMRNRGFSLIELMIGLCAGGHPDPARGADYAIWTADAQIRNGVESIATGLRFAHAEAIKRNTPVEFILDPTTATGGWRGRRRGCGRRRADRVVRRGRLARDLHGDPRRRHDGHVHRHGRDRPQRRCHRDADRSRGDPLRNRLRHAAAHRPRRRRTDAGSRSAIRRSPTPLLRASARPEMGHFRTHAPPQRAQRGSFLLEALIAALIVAFGILGLVGLQARAIQNVDDAQYRSEAAFLANDLLGRMWTSNQATLEADFETGGGTPYDDFKTLVQARLPGATAQRPGRDRHAALRRPHDGLRGRDHGLLAAARRPSQHNYQTAATVKLN